MNPQFVNPEDVTATMPEDVFDRSQALQAERQKTVEGLPTFGETMYRSTADIIGTPVDLASMALAPFGYSEKAPIGGSEYFKQMGEQKGIISSASNPILEIAASLVVPDPLDVLTVTKMATPLMMGAIGLGGDVGRKMADDVPEMVDDVKPFYSQLERYIEGGQNAYTKEQAKGFLSKQGLKEDEMKWSGLKDYLDSLPEGSKVTKQELQEVVNPPKLEKKVLGELPKKETEDMFILDYEDLDDEVIDYLISLDPQDREVAEQMMKQSNQNLLTDGTFENEWNKMITKYPDQDHNIIHDVNDALFDEYHEAYSKADFEPKYREYATRDVGTNYREELTTLGLEDKKEKELNILYDEIANNPYKYPRGSDKYNDYLDLSQEIAETKTGKTIVNKPYSDGSDRWVIYDKDGNVQPKMYGENRQGAIAELNNEARISDSSYKSSHWDEPNVLYHVRKQDTNIEGDNTLLIEEIQSDWHQAGRQSGYKGSQDEIEKAKKASNDYKEMLKTKYGLEDATPMKLRAYLRDNGLTEERDTLNRLSAESNAVDKALAVPQAPYSKTWHEKAMKDQIAEAVEKDYDRVAWVAGKEQAGRYSLSKQIDKLEAEEAPLKDGTYDVWIYKDGERDYLGNKTKLELSDTIGKDMAEKVVKDNGGIYEGLDLEVGGEGMKGFYDKMLPKWVSKYIKKYDSSVEIKELPNGQKVWSFPVTDKMKREVSTKGQPLYTHPATVGAVGLGIGAGAMYEEEEGL